MVMTGALGNGCSRGCQAGPQQAADIKPAEPRPSVQEPDPAGELRLMIDRLLPLHRPLEPPGPGDWLDQHHEPGQTFQQYLAINPTTARGKRRVIYIQPIGSFQEAQRRIVKLTAELMGIYFGLPVKIADDLPITADWPESARRVHPRWGDEQLLTGYILGEVLAKRLPEDAATYLGLSAMDLWPGRGWNFVFGQASLRERVGVWSIYRNGDPAGGDEAFRLCLLRTLKTATHETGHMLSMLHCTAFECDMCGSNHRDESDRRPLALCPHCLAKLCWATGVDPAERFRKLADFCRREGLVEEAEFYEKSRKGVKSNID